MNIRYAIAGLIIAILASPSVAQERQWQLDAAEVDAFLLFGVPGTTDVGVSFWCKINSGEVNIFAPLGAAPKEPQTISLSINDIKFQLSAAPSTDAGTKTVEANLQPQKVIFDELLNAERFTLSLNNHKVTYPLDGADIKGLLKICGTEQHY